MGYIGLLLNDPYKIDRMMGVCLIHFFFYFFYLFDFALRRVNEPR
jgi:hypothetical protein